LWFVAATKSSLQEAAEVAMASFHHLSDCDRGLISITKFRKHYKDKLHSESAP